MTDRQYLFELYQFKMYELLTFLLGNNEELFNATSPYMPGGMNLGKISYEKKDSELLGVLLSLNSPVFTA